MIGEGQVATGSVGRHVGQAGVGRRGARIAPWRRWSVPPAVASARPKYVASAARDQFVHRRSPAKVGQRGNCTGLAPRRPSNTTLVPVPLFLRFKIRARRGPCESARHRAIQQNIESVLLEERQFPPPAEFTARARLQACRSRCPVLRGRSADHVGFWARSRARASALASPFHTSRSTNRTRRTTAGSSTATSTSPTTASTCISPRRRNKTAIICEGEPGEVRRLTYTRAARRSLPHGERAQVARRRTRATASSSTCRWFPRRSSRCTPARASVRFIRWCSAASRRCRSRIASRTRARECSSRPMAVTAAATSSSSSSLSDKALAGGCPTIEKVIVLKRTGESIPMKPGRDLWWHDVVARQPAECEPEWVERGASALSSVHLGLDRQTEGHPAFLGRLPARREDDVPVGVRSQRLGHLLVHGRHRLGDGPQLRRLRTARCGRDHRHVRRGPRRTPTAGASGRSARSTASRCSTPRRRSSAH